MSNATEPISRPTNDRVRSGPGENDNQRRPTRARRAEASEAQLRRPHAAALRRVSPTTAALRRVFPDDALRFRTAPQNRGSELQLRTAPQNIRIRSGPENAAGVDLMRAQWTDRDGRSPTRPPRGRGSATCHPQRPIGGHRRCTRPERIRPTLAFTPHDTCESYGRGRRTRPLPSHKRDRTPRRPTHNAKRGSSRCARSLVRLRTQPTGRPPATEPPPHRATNATEHCAARRSTQNTAALSAAARVVGLRATRSTRLAALDARRSDGASTNSIDLKSVRRSRLRSAIAIRMNYAGHVCAQVRRARTR
jgi:hypothetical protein